MNLAKWLRVSGIGIGLPVLFAATAPSATAQSGPWRQYGSAGAAGYSGERLGAAFDFADSIGSAAVMVVEDGIVVAAWGDVERKLALHSVRKSLLSLLYGIAVDRGEIDLGVTLSDLEFDDLEGLTPVEKGATLAHLISARSGVYHPAAYAPKDQDRERPERGSHAPGTNWFYNNWDFNVAESAFERSTGLDEYTAFSRWIAEPLGMQDWSAADGFEVLEPSKSIWPAHTYRMSTRDLARLGLLVAQRGRWDGNPIVSEAWIDRSTSAVSDLGEGQGYGYMWWIYAAGSLPDRYEFANRHTIVLARGTGGQALFVIPDADLVVVHRGDTDNGREVDGGDVWMLVEMLLGARTGEPAGDIATVALVSRPLPSALPAPETLVLTSPRPEAMQPYLGSYEFGPGAIGRVFLHDERAFLHVPGEGDGELFLRPDGTFTVRVVEGVTIRFADDGAGEVRGLELTLEGQRMTASRIP